MLAKVLNGGLRQTLMITMIVSLVFCIAILLIIITNSQSHQLKQLNGSVNGAVEKNNLETKEKFIALANKVSDDLKKDLGNTSDTLAIEISQKIVAQTEILVKQITNDLEAGLHDSANALAALLIQVAPSAIVTNNFLALNNYVKSASHSANVVYAIFLKPGGRPLTGYFNRNNPIIKRYLKTGKGRKKKDKIINASKQDKTVFFVKRSVVVEGQNYGNLLLCISQASTNQKINRLSRSFINLNKSIRQKTTSDLGSMAKAVAAKVERNLFEARSISSAATGNISTEVKKITRQIKQKTGQVVLTMGIFTILINLGIMFIVISRLSKVINNTITGLNNDADQVSEASNVVLSSSQSLAEGASDQASSIEETGASLEEIAAMTKQNAGNAGKADQLMQETNHIILKANAAMGDLITSMDEISNASKETSKIVKTIDEIAFQTNLLALNASVEAARAGEAGAGFAVVADEVRNLAMRAADAARNTSDLIETTVKKVMDGSQLVNVTNNTFSKVLESAKQVGELVGDIAVTSEEQSSGIEQVNIAVAEVDKVVQQNAVDAEASASASKKLNQQSVQMKGYIRDLIALMKGEKANTQTREEASLYQAPKIDLPMVSHANEEAGPDRCPVIPV